MKLFKYNITDSTNLRAREFAKSNDAEFPAVFIAREQSAGRGRMGRSFDSAAGAGLYMTVLFKPSDAKLDFQLLTVRTAVVACRALKKICGLDVGIKWVNDLYVDGKKLAGILAEGELDAQSGECTYAMCGIGINLLSRTFPKELSNIATTVEDACGVKIDADELAAELVREFFSPMRNEEFMSEYRTRSVVVGKTVEVHRISGERFLANAVGISDTGALSVITEDGKREELISAEVSIKI